MAKLIKIPLINDDRGSLAVVEKISNFDIKRVYYIFNTNGKKRGGHRHKKTDQILICLNGSCNVFCVDEAKRETKYKLNRPDKGLLIEKEDWHFMDDFTKDCLLLVLASEYFDKGDYITDAY